MTRRRRIRILIRSEERTVAQIEDIQKIDGVIGCCSALVLGGCKNPVTDGPGMEYIPQWKGFTVSRTDSLAQYAFWFAVSDDGEEPLVTGECRDAEGNLYLEETGIRISSETLWQLRRLNLEKLEVKTQTEEIPGLLDGSAVTLSLTLPDGEIVEMKASGELSLQIYSILLPYFVEN